MDTNEKKQNKQKKHNFRKIPILSNIKWRGKKTETNNKNIDHDLYLVTSCSFKICQTVLSDKSWKPESCTSICQSIRAAMTEENQMK